MRSVAIGTSTASELSKLDTTRWAVIDDVAIDGHRVDHVLVGPGRVFTVETERANTLERADRERLVQRATRGACRLERLLQAQGAPAHVTPLVVLWGPGTSAMAGPVERLGAVRLVAGPKGKRWRKDVDRSAEGSGPDPRVLEALRAVPAAG